jgi:uncharacterized membrane protein YeaQ/YmgE (transglycosylase-associated protein family)
MTSVKGMTKERMAKNQCLLLLVSHLPFGRPSSFGISFAWLRLGNFAIAGLISKSQKLEGRNMLHLIWYVFVGFLVGCVAKALMHTHLSITWTVVLGIVRSIIGGAVTHLFYPPGAGGKFHLGGLIVSIIGAILALYIWHKFRLQLPRG